MTVGVNAADGSINVTVVDGTTYTGLYAADGSINVVVNDGSTYEGVEHPCGAYNVVVYSSGQPTLFAPNGSFYVSESPYTEGTMKVTAVSGSLGGGGPVSPSLNFSINTNSQYLVLLYP